MTSLPTFAAPDLAAVALTAADRERIQSLFEACTDYFELVNGEPARPGEAESALTELPPGKGPEDKFVLGVTARGTDLLLGLVDVVRDYPETGEWYIGLLLLHPAQRNRGLGAAIHDALASWAHEHGARALRLGVLVQNEGAVRFWERLGFREILRREVRFGRKDSLVRVMRRALPDGPA